MDNLLLKYDCVFINDLTLQMSIGIYDHEKSAPQNVIINVKIYVKKQDGNIIENIENVVSYEIIALNIRDICNSRHFEFVEKLAEEISIMCLQNALSQIVEVEIEKPDIIKDTKSVGVKILRQKD